MLLNGPRECSKKWLWVSIQYSIFVLGAVSENEHPLYRIKAFYCILNCLFFIRGRDRLFITGIGASRPFRIVGISRFFLHPFTDIREIPCSTKFHTSNTRWKSRLILVSSHKQAFPFSNILWYCVNELWKGSSQIVPRVVNSIPMERNQMEHDPL